MSATNDLQQKVSEVLNVLNRTEIRCTYNALAEYCGVDIRAIINCLGDRRPLASWIVNRKTLRPTDYGPNQENLRLYSNSRVINSAIELAETVAESLRSDNVNKLKTAVLSLNKDDCVPCYGVDGCKGGWLYAAFNGDEISFGTVVCLEDLITRADPGSRVFVDIPIGLRDDSGTPRLCDQEARRLLRPLRASSVFSAPLRTITSIEDYAQANATSKQIAGKGLSKQSFNITPKIREADLLMLGNSKARDAIREVHPEICFFGIAGGRPMQYSKRTKEGFDERLSLLAKYLPGVKQSVEAALANYPRKLVASDDILDAIVAALTARLSDHWKTLPANPEIDSQGLPMEMVYCAM